MTQKRDPTAVFGTHRFFSDLYVEITTINCQGHLMAIQGFLTNQLRDYGFVAKYSHIPAKDNNADQHIHISLAHSSCCDEDLRFAITRDVKDFLRKMEISFMVG